MGVVISRGGLGIQRCQERGGKTDEKGIGADLLANTLDFMWGSEGAAYGLFTGQGRGKRGVCFSERGASSEQERLLRSKGSWHTTAGASAAARLCAYPVIQ